jgi:hypothetical protein
MPHPETTRTIILSSSNQALRRATAFSLLVTFGSEILASGNVTPLHGAELTDSIWLDISILLRYGDGLQRNSITFYVTGVTGVYWMIITEKESYA